MAKTKHLQEHVYVPSPTKKRARIGLLFLVILGAAGVWVLNEEGIFKQGVQEFVQASKAVTQKNEAN